MTFRPLSTFGALLLLASGVATAQGINEQSFGPGLTPPFPNGTSGSYGRGEGQSFELSIPRRDAAVPLVVFLADEADFGTEALLSVNTLWLPTELFDQGYAVARIDHRPSDRFGGQAVALDVAAGIAKVVEAGAGRVDGRRIVLVGPGSGAHFALLLGTDPHYLEAVGVPFSSLRAVIAINPAGFDVPRRIAEGGISVRRYERVFGRDPVQQQQLSPASQLAAPNVPAVMLFAVRDGSEDYAARANEVAAAFERAGSKAEVHLVTRNARTARTALGTPQHPDTPALLEFLRSATR